MTGGRASGGRSVLHVIATLGTGGTETACLSLATALAARGDVNHVAALSTGDGGIVEAIAAVAGPPVLLPAGRVRRAAAFRGLCRRLRPDVVILHFFTIDHVMLGAAARSAGVARVVAVQGNPAPDPSRRALRRKVALILALSRALGLGLVSASRWIEGSLREVGRLPRDARVVHNACPVDAIAARAAAARQARTDADAVVTMVARLDPIKDHGTLLTAIARMPATVGGRPVRLNLVGDGVLRAALEARAQALGIAARVAFLGARRDVAEILGASDAFVLSTTREEGFGVALAEALAAGVPVLASDVPACREVLSGGLGTLVPAGDPDALAGALRAVLERSSNDRPRSFESQIARRPESGAMSRPPTVSDQRESAPAHVPLRPVRSERQDYAPESEAGTISDRSDDSIRADSALEQSSNDRPRSFESRIARRRKSGAMSRPPTVHARRESAVPPALPSPSEVARRYGLEAMAEGYAALFGEP